MLTSWVADCTQRRKVSCQRSKRAFLPVRSLQSLGQTDRTRKDTTYQMFSQLGMLLGNQARYLQMVPASQVGEDVLVGHDLILIGEPANNPLVAEALKSAPVKIDGNTRAIQSTLLHLTVEDGQPVGLVQEFTSPWDKLATFCWHVAGQERTRFLKTTIFPSSSGRCTNRGPGRSVREFPERSVCRPLHRLPVQGR
jgi:hypothetical protein